MTHHAGTADTVSGASFGLECAVQRDACQIAERYARTKGIDPMDSLCVSRVIEAQKIKGRVCGVWAESKVLRSFY